jgi:hypothetical protein
MIRHENIPALQPGQLFAVRRPGRDQSSHPFDSEAEALAMAQAWCKEIEAELRRHGSISQKTTLHYVCLLGFKPVRGKGKVDEIAGYYPGYHNPALSTGQRGRPFVDLLSEAAGDRFQFVIHHYPTTDHEPMDDKRVQEVCKKIRELMENGETVLLGCSYAQGRTGSVLDGLRGE